MKSQNELARLYEEQQNASVSYAMNIQKNLAKQFSLILNIPVPKIERVEQMKNERTGEVFYFIAD